MYLEDVPLTAYAICYGPLLITVVGFVVFAALTDSNARRTYLRRDIKEPRRDTTRTAEIPEGSVVTIEPIIGEVSTASVAASPSAPPAPRASSGSDELTRLEGIGPKTAEALIAAGLDTFEKIAAASEDDFKAAMEAAGLNFTPSMESWAEQASYAAKGDWEGLAAFQATLISGRYPPKN